MLLFLRVCFWALAVISFLAYARQTFFVASFGSSSVSPLDGAVAIVVCSTGLIGLAITYSPLASRPKE